MADAVVTRERLIDLLNEDLAREYQAIIAYVVYSQALKGWARSLPIGALAKQLWPKGREAGRGRHHEQHARFRGGEPA